MNKKVISLLLASLFVLTAFGGLVSVAGDSGPQISSHSTSLAEGGGSGRTSGGSAPFNEFGQIATIINQSVKLRTIHRQAEAVY